MRNRAERRYAVSLERRAAATGNWGVWEHTQLPNGPDGARAGGWLSKVRAVSRNELYVVLLRTLATEWGMVDHLAIRTASNLEPPWRDKQRIKNELFSPECTAVEVMPPEAELIDEVDMYHMWVLPPGFLLPFTIGKR